MDQAAVRPHLGPARPLGAVELVPRVQQSGFQDHAEGNPRLGLLRAHDRQVFRGRGQHLGDARLRQRRIAGVPLDADEPSAQALGRGPGGADAEERVQHHVARPGGGQQHPVQQGFGLLGRMGLVAVRVLHPLLAGAQGDQPVGPHLQVVIGGLQGVVVEGVALLAPGPRGPDQGLRGIGEAGALEVRHGVGLAPDHIVQDPVAQILQGRADAEDVVIAADDPKGPVILQHPPGLRQPGAGEAVIGLEAVEAVPLVVHRIDPGLVRTGQFPAELQVVGRIGKDEIDGPVGQGPHHLDAITDQDLAAHSWAPANGNGVVEFFRRRVSVPDGRRTVKN